MLDTDTALVAAALRGDQAGVAGMYDRYADRLTNYAWSVCRSHADASDIVHDTFITASERLGQLRDPERLRPWLYAIARNQALRVIRERERVDVTSEIDMASDDPQPDTGLDARQLVWDAAAGLDPKDRDILTLHLREGLEGEDLAAALGVKPNAANVALFRVRERLEHAVGAVLLARFARGACEELDAMMADQLTPLIRKRAARHIDQCDDCQEGRRRIGSPAALFAATPAALAPAALRDTVLASWGTAPPPATDISSWRHDGFPEGGDLAPSTGAPAASAPAVSAQPAAFGAAAATAATTTTDTSVRGARIAAVGGIAVVAIGVALFALLRPAPDATDQLATVNDVSASVATTTAPTPSAAPSTALASAPPTTVADAAAATTAVVAVTAPTTPAPPPTAATVGSTTTTPAPETTKTTVTVPDVPAPPEPTEPGSPSPFPPPVAQLPVDQPLEAAGDSVALSVLDFQCGAVIRVRLLVSGSSNPTVVIRYVSTSSFVTDIQLTESASEPNIYEAELPVLEGEHRISARARAGSASDSELLAASCGQIG